MEQWLLEYNATHPMPAITALEMWRSSILFAAVAWFVLMLVTMPIAEVMVKATGAKVWPVLAFAGSTLLTIAMWLFMMAG
jgi:hypothetical protein